MEGARHVEETSVREVCCQNEIQNSDLANTSHKPYNLTGLALSLNG